MGGKNEDTIKTQVTKGETIHAGQLRFHISNGNVHFHDDANKLKAEMSVADWFVVLRAIQSLEPKTRVDSVHGTMIHFSPMLENGNFDVKVTLEAIKLSETANKLYKLIGR